MSMEIEVPDTTLDIKLKKLDLVIKDDLLALWEYMEEVRSKVSEGTTEKQLGDTVASKLTDRWKDQLNNNKVDPLTALIVLRGVLDNIKALKKSTNNDAG